ncbi:hypothetical protein ACFO4O_14190 [Glaciecola siphonariae]|uniref:Phosphopantetheine adenylyltransferase n=1 Tax=Glaciecola siphonariae TaxID=521012 RepID=A0ABV9LXM2_9ALTE
MNKVITIGFLVVGIIHLIPVVGVLGIHKINDLYGLSIADQNLAILMRHRAVMFGLLGSFLCYAAFMKNLQIIALIAALISVVSFLLLSLFNPNYNQAIQKIVSADYLALAILCVVAVLMFIQVKSI